MKTIYNFLVIVLLSISMGGNAQPCTGNFTPSITPSMGTCGDERVYCAVGKTITLTLQIADGNSDPVTLSTPDATMLLPATATVSQTLPYNAQAPYSVTVTWSPVLSEMSVSQFVRFRVVDPCTGTDCILEFYALDPCDVNFTPSVNFSVGSGCDDTQINGKIGQDTTFTVYVDDSDGDSVTLSLPYAGYQLPASATVTPALPYKGQTPYSVSVTWTPAASEYLDVQTLRWLVRDSCTGTTCEMDLSARCSMPTVTCPSSITQQADYSDCTTEVFYQATATGLPAPSLLYSHVPGSVFERGTTPVTVTATNTCGTATCSFDVTVIPPAPPTVTCPADITASVSGKGCSAVVTYVATASSGIGIESFSSTPASGSTFNQGTTVVTATATDACGTTNSCSFNVNVNSDFSVDAGADASSVFGYASTQTVNRTATITGGTGPFTYAWTLSRPLKCNVVNSSGDELFIGGSCTNNICPTSGTATSAAPACSGSNSISATLLEGADVCVTVTDDNGCTATDCFHIDAVDGRCFTGNAGKNKTKICHLTGSPNNPSVTICIAKSATNTYLANHPGDFLGGCASKRVAYEEVEISGGITFRPNPFNRLGTFYFTIPDDSYAELEVYSYTGAKVATLFRNHVLAETETEVQFDGSDLCAGIYLCKLTAGDQVYYTRVVLSK